MDTSSSHYPGEYNYRYTNNYRNNDHGDGASLDASSTSQLHQQNPGECNYRHDNSHRNNDNGNGASLDASSTSQHQQYQRHSLDNSEHYQQQQQYGHRRLSYPPVHRPPPPPPRLQPPIQRRVSTGTSTTQLVRERPPPPPPLQPQPPIQRRVSTGTSQLPQRPISRRVTTGSLQQQQQQQQQQQFFRQDVHPPPPPPQRPLHAQHRAQSMPQLYQPQQIQQNPYSQQQHRQEQNGLGQSYHEQSMHTPQRHEVLEDVPEELQYETPVPISPPVMTKRVSKAAERAHQRAEQRQSELHKLYVVSRWARRLGGLGITAILVAVASSKFVLPESLELQPAKQHDSLSMKAAHFASSEHFETTASRGGAWTNALLLPVEYDTTYVGPDPRPDQYLIQVEASSINWDEYRLYQMLLHHSVNRMKVAANLKPDSTDNPGSGHGKIKAAMTKFGHYLTAKCQYYLLHPLLPYVFADQKIPGTDFAGIVIRTPNGAAAASTTPLGTSHGIDDDEEDEETYQQQQTVQPKYKFEVGDRVAARLPEFGTPWGTQAETVVVHERFLAKIPDSTSFATAAALPTVALTVLQSLDFLDTAKDNGGLKMLVLANGNSGSYDEQNDVAYYAIQYAKHALGIQDIIVATCSPAVSPIVELFKRLGVTYVVHLAALTDGEIRHHFDVIFDTCTTGTCTTTAHFLSSDDGDENNIHQQIAATLLKRSGHYVATFSVPEAVECISATMTSSHFKDIFSRVGLRKLVSAAKIIARFFVSKIVNFSGITRGIMPQYRYVVLVHPDGDTLQRALDLASSAKAIRPVIRQKVPLSLVTEAFRTAASEEIFDPATSEGKTVLFHRSRKSAEAGDDHVDEETRNMVIMQQRAQQQQQQQEHHVERNELQPDDSRHEGQRHPSDGGTGAEQQHEGVQHVQDEHHEQESWEAFEAYLEELDGDHSDDPNRDNIQQHEEPQHPPGDNHPEHGQHHEHNDHQRQEEESQPDDNQQQAQAQQYEQHPPQEDEPQHIHTPEDNPAPPQHEQDYQAEQVQGQQDESQERYHDEHRHDEPPQQQHDEEHHNREQPEQQQQEEQQLQHHHEEHPPPLQHREEYDEEHPVEREEHIPEEHPPQQQQEQEYHEEYHAEEHPPGQQQQPHEDTSLS